MPLQRHSHRPHRSCHPWIRRPLFPAATRIIHAAVGAAILATLLTGCKPKESTPPARGEGEKAAAENGKAGGGEAAHADEVKLSPEAVARYGIKVEPAAKHVLTPTLLAPARVSFNTEAMAHVGSPLRGRAIALQARLGDTVKQGDVLVVIESPELGEAQSDFLQKRSAAQSAGPAAELAKSAHDRAKSLYEQSQGISLTEVQKREAEYRAAQAALVAANAAVMAAENKLHLFGMHQEAVEALAAKGEVDPHLAITAPLAGQVVEREVTQGELVGPEKEALLVLADVTTLWVLADVPEARLREIAAGSKARVMLGTDDSVTFPGTVAFVSPVVDPSTRSAQVRVEVKEGAAAQEGGGLRPGMFARVEVQTRPPAQAGAPGAPAAELAVPDEAVQTVEGSTVVFVPVPGEPTPPQTFKKRTVRIGRTVGGMVPVFSGLKEGEPVVVAGSFILKAELGKGAGGEE